MVQGAPQVAGRFPDLVRQYKAPPPEICSEQFYETDPARGFARGFSIQTVGPLPIGWAEHVLADGHWGRALREYMRDYNHWFTLGALNELLPHPDNRVTLADETDAHGIPIARMDYSQSDNDRANIAYAKASLHDIWEAAGAQDTLTIDRYAHLVGGCRMGTAPETASSTQTTASGASEPVHRRRLRDADPGLRQPGADDHGARLPPGRPARPPSARAGPSAAGAGAWLPAAARVGGHHPLPQPAVLDVAGAQRPRGAQRLPKLYLSDHCPPGRELVRFTKKVFCADSRRPWTSLDEEESGRRSSRCPGARTSAWPATGTS